MTIEVHMHATAVAMDARNKCGHDTGGVSYCSDTAVVDPGLRRGDGRVAMKVMIQPARDIL
jgi:hypothetical protein